MLTTDIFVLLCPTSHCLVYYIKNTSLMDKGLIQFSIITSIIIYFIYLFVQWWRMANCCKKSMVWLNTCLFIVVLLLYYSLPWVRSAILWGVWSIISLRSRPSPSTAQVLRSSIRDFLRSVDDTSELRKYAIMPLFYMQMVF